MRAPARSRPDVAGDRAVRRPDRAREPHGRGASPDHAADDQGALLQPGPRRRARSTRRSSWLSLGELADATADRAHPGPAQDGVRRPSPVGTAEAAAASTSRQPASTRTNRSRWGTGCVRSSTAGRRCCSSTTTWGWCSGSAISWWWSSSGTRDRGAARRAEIRENPSVVEAYLGAADRLAQPRPARPPTRGMHRERRAGARHRRADRRLRRRPGAARPRPARRRRRGGGAPRPERRREDHHAASDLGPRAPDGRRDPPRRGRPGPPLTVRPGPARHRPRARGTRRLLRPHRRRALPPRLSGRAARDRHRVRVLPGARRARRSPGRAAVRR